MSKNEVVKKENAAAPVPAEMLEMAGEGLENVSVDEVLIPRLTILQALSPQLDETSAEYDPEAKAGDIYDIALRERFPDGALVVPVHYEKRYIEWPPREEGSGAGPVAIYETLDGVSAERDENFHLRNTVTGNRIVETALFYVLNLSAGGRKSFISMASSQLKRARQWLTYATAEQIVLPDGNVAQAPLFYRTYLLTSVPDRSPKGKYYSWQIERREAIHERNDYRQIMANVKSFREALARRQMVAAMEDENSAVEVDAEVM